MSAKGPDEALQALRACDIAVVQANFNMMDVRVLSSGLLAEVERLGIGFIARTPLCFGFLSGTIGHDSVFPEGDHRARWPRAQLANWVDGAADLMAAISTAPGEAAACGRAALLPVVPGGIDHDSRHHAAARGRPERGGQPPGAAAICRPWKRSWRSIEIDGSSSRLDPRRDEIQEIAAAEQVSVDAGGRRGLQVGLAIADQERLRGVDRPLRPEACGSCPGSGLRSSETRR